MIAGYSTRRLTLGVDGLTVQLLVVSQLEDYVDAETLLRDTEAPEPPYWAHLWPGSRSLARLIATEVMCRGRRVVEIGCGVGLVGITAALRGAVVTAMDTAYPAVCFARANAALNDCHVTALQADVRHSPLHTRFDYCFAADVTYDPALQVAVAEFLAGHLAEGGRAWCAESVRTLDRGFHETCTHLGLVASERDVRELDDGRPVAVRITEITRR